MNSAHVLGKVLARLRNSPSFLWRAEAVFKGVSCGKVVVFRGRPMISVANDSRLILSDGVCINSALRSNLGGCFQPSILRTLAPGAELRLGANVGISAVTICAGKEITIGENTIIGTGAILLDNDIHALNPDGTWRDEYVQSARPIRVGKSVFIGTHAIIMKGVKIGDAAIIGAGAVVTRNVPANAIFFGNPAWEIGRRPEPPSGKIDAK